MKRKLTRTLFGVAILAMSQMPVATDAKAEIPFIGEIRMFASNYCPTGWQKADGTLLPISIYEALFALIGTTYGGDGQTTFALPAVKPVTTLINGAPYTTCIALQGIFPSQP